MMTRSVKIRRHLRAARTAALTSEERREALRAAEKAREQQDVGPVQSEDATRASSHAPRPGAK